MITNLKKAISAFTANKPQQLKIKRLTSSAKLPTYGTKGAACFDLYADNQAGGKRAVVGTGLAMEIPKGYALMIYGRSGNAFSSGWRLGNCVGVIDSDYRGEVKVLLQTDKAPLSIRKGDRIAQAMLVPVPAVEFDLVVGLNDTARGKGGFWSTGK